MIYKIQRDKFFPLPTYDLSVPNRVLVTIYGKILDKNYTQLLYANENLNIKTIFLLDQVQKKITISKEDATRLKKEKLIEGRYPNVYVSFKVADAVGQKTNYIVNKGLDESVCRQLILQALRTQPSHMKAIFDILDRGALSAVLTKEQKIRKVSNLLQKMKREDLIYPKGPRNQAVWHIKQTGNKT